MSKFYIFLGGMIAFFSFYPTREALLEEGVPEEAIDKLMTNVAEVYEYISLFKREK